MPPAVINTINDFRAGLLASEESAMRAASVRWLQVEQTLQAQTAVLAQQMSESNVVTMGAMSRMRRYQALREQTRDELRRYSGYMEDRIVAGQRDMAVRAVAQAQATVQAVAADAEMVVQFDRLPISAVEDMIGLVGDGSPVRDILNDAAKVGPDAMAQRLVEGIALGRNPVEVARQAIRAGLGQSFSRMQTISRTETLRIWRTTTLQSYEQSNIIAGYTRISARDDRVCPACLFADGRFYPVDYGFDQHPNCRCALLPRLKNVPPTQFETGQEWFAKQPEATQRTILGRGRYDLWSSGRASLDDMVTRVDNQTWGGSLQTTTLKDLTG